MKEFDSDKIAQKTISKKVHSARKREIRKLSVVMPGFNKKYCGECGFRIRGENHLNGTQHRGLSISHRRK